MALISRYIVRVEAFFPHKLGSQGKHVFAVVWPLKSSESDYTASDCEKQEALASLKDE